MGKLSNLNQKVTGIGQQVKGNVEIASGEKIQGNVDKYKGKANVKIADLKNKVGSSKYK